ncbi:MULTISPECIES: ATP-grasp domain-containing protein [unclassified Deinococcus]|uniref:ATP-grasp domain-containing protein n=1 Tax=unclassified Deinococcus TaxID=2623546 RepID=UPI000991F99C|nr:MULTISPECIES: ATP-grasp domain-containing protein [unclassified Deinococcus]MBX8465821.1 ATP-grasp domain-containing protein [Deinococcus sp. RIT780]NTX99133.1 ATP-grasp domain-containing protein [Deinococcus sp. JMULE3]
MSKSEISWVVLVHASDNILKTALSEELNVILLRKQNQWTSYGLTQAQVCLTVDDALENLDGLAAVLNQYPIGAVLSFMESGVLLAAALRERCGLPGTPLEAVQRLKDKALMRAHLHDRGCHHLSVAAHEVTHLSALQAHRAALQGRVIVKPVTGTGSVHIYALDPGDDVPAPLINALGQGIRFLAEPFLQGLEFSVEALTINGKHHIVAVTEKVVNEHFVEVGHCIPPRRMSPDALQGIAAAVREFLTAIGLVTGPSHTEVMWHEGRVTIIESHDRVGGDKITALVTQATGVDLIRMGLRLAAGRTVDPPPELQCLGAACVIFLTPPPGRVLSISLVPLPPELPILERRAFVHPGDVLTQVRSSKDRSGLVVASGPTPEEAFHHAQLGARSIQFSMAVDHSAHPHPVPTSRST